MHIGLKLNLTAQNNQLQEGLGKAAGEQLRQAEVSRSLPTLIKQQDLQGQWNPEEQAKPRPQISSDYSFPL